MWRYAAWRLPAMLASIAVSVSLVFVGMSLVPGDPAEAGLGSSSITLAQIAERRAAFGLDRPLGEQYLHYMTNLARGDLGVSWMSGQSVSVMLSQQFGATAALTLAGLLVAILIGIPMGVLSAFNDNPALTAALQVTLAAAVATPVLISGTVLVMLFAVLLNWLPATGQGTPAQLVMPAAVVGLNVGGSLAKAVESGLAETRRQPFTLFGRAKGLSRWQTLWRHSLPVGLLPVLEMFSLQAGYLFSGAVITETLFARQGIGRLLVAGILNKDIPVVLGVALISIVLYSILHLLVDLGYAALDPRIRARI